MFIQEKPTLCILIKKKKDIWGGQGMLQFKMMKCYSLHTKIKNEMKLKKWNGYQSNAGQGIKGEGSHTIKKKSKRASASRSLQNKGASVSKTRTFHGSTSKLSHSIPSPRQHNSAVLLCQWPLTLLRPLTLLQPLTTPVATDPPVATLPWPHWWLLFPATLACYY